MKRALALFVMALFLSAASLVAAKDYQVTGPVVDVKDDVIVVKKGTENWEIARDKNTKAPADIKKGDRVMIKYKMTATSIESKESTKAKSDTKAKTDTKAKAATDSKMSTDTKPKTEAKTK
jgi:GH43 family beta-xylosidase